MLRCAIWTLPARTVAREAFYKIGFLEQNNYAPSWQRAHI